MKYACSLLLLAFSLTAQAQWTSNILLNTEVKDSVGPEESVPLSATTSDGKTWVSYFAQYSGSYQMRLQLLDSAGNRLLGTSGLLVSNQPQSTALFRYDLKCDGSGNAIVAFQDTRTAGQLHIVAYKVDQQGNQLWGANGIQLIDPQSDQGLSPTIGFTHAGNVIISWNASSSSGQWVSAKMVDPAGSNMWAGFLQIKDPAGTKRYGRPTVVPCGADGFLMLYVETTGFGLGVSNMYAMRYDFGGNGVWAQPVHFSTNTISFFFFPQAVSDGLDGFYTGFTTSNATNPAWSDVYVQHIDSTGNVWNNTGNAASNAPAEQRFCAAAHRDPVSGNLYVLLKTTDPNQNMSGAAVQGFDISGNVLMTATAPSIVPTSATYDDPWDFAVTNNGIIAFYVSGNFGTQTIQAVKCDFTGSLQWGGFPAGICSKPSSKDDLMAGLFVNDQAVLVWMDQRNDYGVYAQNVTNSGTTGLQTYIGLPAAESWNIYPNPFTSSVYVNSNWEGAVTVQVFDIAGRLIKTDRVYAIPGISTELQLADLPAGEYVARFNQQNQTARMRLHKR